MSIVSVNTNSINPPPPPPPTCRRALTFEDVYAYVHTNVFGSVPFAKIGEAMVSPETMAGAQQELMLLRMIRILKLARAVKFVRKINGAPHFQSLSL